MNLVITTIIFIFILSFLVTFHELGHYLAAKYFRIEVEEFAIGFGPTLLKKRFKNTDFKINLFPLGGYVLLDGEKSRNSSLGFRNQGFFKKLIVLSAGVFVNFILGWLFLSIFLFINKFTVFFPKIINYEFSSSTTNILYIDKNSIISNSLRSEQNSENIGLLINADKNLKDFIKSNEFEFIFDQDLNSKYLISNDFKSLGLKIELENESRVKSVLSSGEIIFGINSEEFYSIDEFIKLLEKYEGKTVLFTLYDVNNFNYYEKEVTIPGLENGTRLGAKLTPFLGFDFYYNNSEDLGNYYAVSYDENILISGLIYTKDFIFYQVNSFANILKNSYVEKDLTQISDATGGIVRVATTTGDIVNSGELVNLIPFIGMISLSLAIFNILPIPALDGGQIVLYFFEFISRRRISDNILNKINMVGFLCLMILGVIVTIKDLFSI